MADTKLIYRAKIKLKVLVGGNNVTVLFFFFLEGAMRQVSRISSISTESRTSQGSVKGITTDLDEVDYDAVVPQASMIDILRFNSPEWLIICIACIGSIVMGTAMPVFAILFGNILGVSNLKDSPKVNKIIAK